MTTTFLIYWLGDPLCGSARTNIAGVLPVGVVLEEEHAERMSPNNATTQNRLTDMGAAVPRGLTYILRNLLREANRGSDGILKPAKRDAGAATCGIIIKCRTIRAGVGNDDGGSLLSVFWNRKLECVAGAGEHRCAFEGSGRPRDGVLKDRGGMLALIVLIADCNVFTVPRDAAGETDAPA